MARDLRRSARRFRLAHHTVGALIVAAWLALMGQLALGEWKKRSVAPDRSVAELLASAGASEVRTYGIYQEERDAKTGVPTGKRTKIGYSASRRMPTAGGYLFIDQAGMQLSIQGIKQRMLSETSAVVGDDFSLKSFRARIRAGGQHIEVEGVVEGSELSVELTTAGRTISDRVPLDRPILLPTLVRASVAARSPKIGDSYVFPIYNPAGRGTEEIEVVVKGREKIGDVDAWRLSEILRGQEASEVWIDDSGEMLRERGTALGFVMEAEPREIAMQIPDENAVPDLVFAAMVPVKGDLAAQVGEGQLRVRLGGIQPAEFPLLAGGWQRIDENLLRIDVQPRAVGDYLLPYLGGDMDEWLSAEPLVQSSDAAIVKTARQIVPEGAMAGQAARKIHEWVFANVRKSNSAGVPSAVEVLEQRTGDCNEHTVLFVALARSVGLPARIGVGVVWANARGGGPGLYYHAWPEVYLGRVGDHVYDKGAATSPGWYPVDPTLGQFPADAGHMRFVVGGLERQIDLLKLIGKLEVETAE